MQRNMAADCGMDFRSAAEFIASIALVQLQSMRAHQHSLDSSGREHRKTVLYSGSSARQALSESQAEETRSSRRGTGAWGTGAMESEGSPRREGADLDQRSLLTAALRLKQAQPMLERLLTRACCGDDSTGRKRAQVGRQQCCRWAAGLTTSASFGDTSEVAAIQGPANVFKFTSYLGGLSDEQFWQGILEVVMEVEVACTSSPAVKEGRVE